MLAELLGELKRLADVSPDELTDAELHEVVVGFEEAHSRFESVRARMVAAWDARKVWADNGAKSSGARLSADCKIAPATARRLVRRARRLRTMPVTEAGLADGSLSVDHVDTLVRANQPEVAHLFARDERVLVDGARESWFWVFEKQVAYWKQLAGEEVGNDDPVAKQYNDRHFTAAVGFDGCTDLIGRLDPVAGAIFRDELDRLEREIFEADWAAARAKHGPDALPHQLPRLAWQRRADALVEMARRSAALSADCKWTRPLITVLVGYETFAGRICELADGTVVSPGNIARLIPEADVERVVFDGPSRVIDVGEKKRFFTGATRRAVEARDRYCTHPSGCDVPSHKCQIDHIIPYACGGPTTQTNGRPHCSVHNRIRNQRPPPEAA